MRVKEDGGREEWELRKMEVERRVGVKEDGGRETSGSSGRWRLREEGKVL